MLYTELITSYNSKKVRGFMVNLDITDIERLPVYT